MVSVIKREMIAELNENALLLPEEFDKALIGYVERSGQETLALYDTELIIMVLIGQGMSEEEARDWFDYNVIGSYNGEGTPAFATILEVEKG